MKSAAREYWLARYFRFVLRHRTPVLAIVAAISLAVAWQISQGVFATSLIKSFLGDDKQFARYKTLRSRFESGDLMVLAFEDPELFGDKGWQRLGRVEHALEELPFVRRVYSVWDAYRIESDAGGVELETYHDLVAASGDYAALKRDVLANKELVGTLVAPDGCCTMLLLELQPYDELPVEDMPASLAALQVPLEREGFRPDQIHMAGLYAETVEGISESRYSVAVIFPFTALILLAAIYLLFGQFWPVLITGLVSLLGTAWTFAVAVGLDHEINLLMAMVPAVTMIISFSDVIHLCSRYLHLLREGAGKEDAIAGCAEEVGSACVYNSVTNAAGFASFMLIPAPVFRTLGLALAIGVLIALVLCMTLVPVLLGMSPLPQVGPEKAPSWSDRLLDGIVALALRISLGRPWLTIAGFAASFVLAAYFIAGISFETTMVDRLQPKNRLQVARRFIQKHFAGTTFLEIYASPKQGDVLEPKTYDSILALEKRVAALDGVDSVQSFTDIIEPINAAMAAGSTTAVPKSRATLAQCMLLVETSGDSTMARLIDDERTSVRLVARLRSGGIRNSSEIGRRVEAAAAEVAPGLDVFTSGLNKLFGDWVGELIVGQRNGLWVALLTTTLTMAYCFRRLGTGIVSMIPNIHPIVLVGGALTFISPVRDSDLLIIAMVTVGNVVDDTIHLVSCMMIEAKRSDDMDVVITRSLGLTGRSMIKATIVLCAGFMPFALSGYSTTRHMGTTLPLTLGLAAVSELLLTPALAKVGLLDVRPRGKPR